MYIIQEMQTTSNKTALLAPVTYTDRDEAESTFHARLAAAAISAVSIHTVVMLNEFGVTIKREVYEH